MVLSWWRIYVAESEGVFISQVFFICRCFITCPGNIAMIFKKRGWRAVLKKSYSPTQKYITNQLQRELFKCVFSVSDCLSIYLYQNHLSTHSSISLSPISYLILFYLISICPFVCLSAYLPGFLPIYLMSPFLQEVKDLIIVFLLFYFPQQPCEIGQAETCILKPKSFNELLS